MEYEDLIREVCLLVVHQDKETAEAVLSRFPPEVRDNSDAASCKEVAMFKLIHGITSLSEGYLAYADFPICEAAKYFASL